MIWNVTNGAKSANEIKNKDATLDKDAWQYLPWCLARPVNN